jgi:hypothetical protein
MTIMTPLANFDKGLFKLAAIKVVNPNPKLDKYESCPDHLNLQILRRLHNEKDAHPSYL